MFRKCKCECEEIEKSIVIEAQYSINRWMGNEKVYFNGVTISKLAAARIINAIAKKVGFDLQVKELGQPNIDRC